MPRESPFAIRLSREERRVLEQRSCQYALSYRDVMRAKIVLLAADGWENTEIGERLDTPRPVVSRWRQRFSRERLAGLEERPRGGHPSTLSPSGHRARQTDRV
jgi:transposase